MQPQHQSIFNYVASRLFDANSPFYFSDGAIAFALSLIIPPLVTWFAFLFWYKRRERLRYGVFRRIIAEGLQRKLMDLAQAANVLITQTMSGKDAAQREQSEQQLEKSLEALEDFAAERTPFFPSEELKQIGEIVQACDFIATISKTARMIADNEPAAIVLHEPVFSLVTKGKNFSLLAGAQPGVAIRTWSEYFDVLQSAAQAMETTTAKFIGLHTAGTWHLQIAGEMLRSVVENGRRFKKNPTGTEMSA
jgi:hypothetical protein